MRIALVVAVARNGVIGRDGDLAWKISDDLKWFKKITTGKPVIMGRRTWESIGKPLPGRTNIVVTRQQTFSAEGALTVSSIDDAVEEAKGAAYAMGADEICIIGGAAIYAETLDRADRIYFTEVNAFPEGDVFFPSFNPGEWCKETAGRAEKSDRNQHSCEFFILDRIKPLK